MLLAERRALAMASKELNLIIAESLSLDEWLLHISVPRHKRAYEIEDSCFPTEAHKDEYLRSIGERADSEIRNLLRLFLFGPGTLGADGYVRSSLLASGSENLRRLRDISEFVRRLTTPPFLAWDGNLWVLDLLPHEPSMAVNVLNAFFQAHGQFIPDGRLHGLEDAIDIIRHKYLNCSNPRDSLLVLQSNDFEFLVGALYEKMGYEVVVTQSSRDGGVDVEAKKINSGEKSVVLIQCKRYEKTVRVQAVRELMGVVAKRQANKGVIVTTARFTVPAIKEFQGCAVIELIDFLALNSLLNSNFGAKWPTKISEVIRSMRLKYSRKLT